jgi:hypothetical protein
MFLSGNLMIPTVYKGEGQIMTPVQMFHMNNVSENHLSDKVCNFKLFKKQ